MHQIFIDKLKENNLFPYFSNNIEIFQVNLGKLCNQTCKHCHVDAGPSRKEVMEKSTMIQCLNILDKLNCKTVDITGGAPELNPNFRWFVTQCFERKVKIIVRCNLTIVEANKKFYDLPDFYKKHNVEVVSSLPYFNSSKTDSQRGIGVFEKSISVLKKFNKIGYGKEDGKYILNLVYNPSGAFLPSSQKALEKEFKEKLKKLFDIEFNSLFTIANVPINRYLDYLINSGNYKNYMEKLINSFNPKAAEKAMCRNTISISWDGYIYDCDFNQMLDLKIKYNNNNIKNVDLFKLENREIIIGQHCFACTAGAGSSCGGETV